MASCGRQPASIVLASGLVNCGTGAGTLLHTGGIHRQHQDTGGRQAMTDFLGFGAALALPEVLGQHHNLGPRQREPGSPHRRRERPQRQLAGPPPVVVQEGLAQARDVGVPRLVLVGHGVALELQQGHVEVRRALDGLRGPAFVVEDEVDEVLVAVREQEMSAE